jgi:hypothetical protein
MYEECFHCGEFIRHTCVYVGICKFVHIICNSKRLEIIQVSIMRGLIKFMKCVHSGILYTCKNTEKFYILMESSPVNI